jgi:hypothetical protein
VHTLLTEVCPVGQPHAPLITLCPVGQLHVPPTKVCPTIGQEVGVVVHAPLIGVCPVGQLHTPLTTVCPVVRQLFCNGIHVPLMPTEIYPSGQLLNCAELLLEGIKKQSAIIITQNEIDIFLENFSMLEIYINLFFHTLEKCVYIINSKINGCAPRLSNVWFYR